MGGDENDSLPGSGDSLDHLLSEARWPTPAQPAVTRLTQHWGQVWSARRRREALVRRAATLAIAATLLGAVTIGWLRPQPKQRPIAGAKGPTGPSVVRTPSFEHRPVVSKSPPPLDTARHETRRPTVAAQSATSEAAPDLTPWRAPNQLELLLLAAADRNPTRSTSSRHTEKQPPSQDPRQASVARAPIDSRRKSSVAPKRASAEAEIVLAAVKRLASDKKANPATIATQLERDRPRHEQVLLGILNRGVIAEQIAALRLLAEIGSPAAVDPVLRSAAVPGLHGTAIGALSRLAESDVVAELVLAEPDAELQQTLLSALLSRGAPASLEQFLNFAADQKTVDAALVAAASVKNPPMDLLFAALSDPLEARRIAAARVIGRIDGPTTTQRLIAMIESGVNRQEACIALLSSRGADAVRYVDSVAERDPTLASILSGARLFTTSDVPPRS